MNQIFSAKNASAPGIMVATASQLKDPKAPSPVFNTLDMLRIEVSCLDDAIKRMENGLDPVLAPAEPESPNELSPMEPPRCELTARLYDLRSAVGRLQALVNGIINRIQV